jgi:tetratricopeptide (TPR) repeat protein
VKSSFAIILTTLALTATCQAIDLGDKAPDLEADIWINGSAVNPAKPDGKTVYVVEFWATWCPPCKRSIPELNSLFEQYQDKNVVIIGVTSEAEETVRPFVEKMEMKYIVAIDTNRLFAETYMDGVQGIPHAFIVDTNGIVVWSGHPSVGLKDSLSEVLAGTYNMETAQTTQGENEELQKLLMAGDFDKALDTLDKLLAKDRENPEYYELKIGLLAQIGKLEKAKHLYQEMFEVFSDSAEDLNTLSWMAVTSPFEMCDLEIAWKAAIRATELSKRENSAILDTLARVYYAAGLLDLAVKTQNEAIEISSGDEDKESLRATLGYYTSAAALRDQIEKAEKEVGP